LILSTISGLWLNKVLGYDDAGANDTIGAAFEELLGVGKTSLSEAKVCWEYTMPGL
jgi:hypothetical protein